MSVINSQYMIQTKTMNQKIITYMNTKTKDGEIILGIDPIIYYAKSPAQYTLVITSSTLYFLQDISIKKYFKASCIDYVALTPFSNQMVFQYDVSGKQSKKQFLRIQSQENVKIVKNILCVRQKFCQIAEQLVIMIEPTNTLQRLTMKDEKGSSKFFGFIFGNKQSHLNSESSRLSGEGKIFSVNSKNFALEIGQKMYSMVYEDTKLLYINSNHNFRFIEELYEVKVINPHKRIYWREEGDKQSKNGGKVLPQSKTSPTSPKNQVQHKINSKQKYGLSQFLMRKISKGTQQQNQQVRRVIQSYKNADYKQQLMYGIQTQTHFQVLTALRNQQKNCHQLLNQHQQICEKDLKSIFFKLIEMIQHSDYIFHSLNPQNIVLTPNGVKISEIFSCLSRRTEIDYIAPEELIHKYSNSITGESLKLINLWKVGVLMYELAYGNVPFPIEYMLKQYNNNKIIIKYPLQVIRTNQFTHFIECILTIQPNLRGIEKNQTNTVVKQYTFSERKQKMLKLDWLRYCK